MQAKPRQLDFRQHDLFVLGTSPLAEALAQVLGTCLPSTHIRLHDDQVSLKYDLLFGSDTNSTTVIAVLDETCGGLKQRVFQLHFQLRKPEVVRRQRICWSGGLVVAGTDRQGVLTASRDPTYHQLRGHCIVDVPLTLLSVLSAVNHVGKLYPRQWQFALNRLGLLSFWSNLREAEVRLNNNDYPSCLRYALEAISQVLDRDALNCLMPHADVIPAIETAKSRLSDLDTAACTCQKELPLILETIRSKMNPFEVGE